MPMRLRGSCRCGTVGFTLDSHTPCPYQLCYCTICRKTAGSGGFAINIGGVAASLAVTGHEAIAVYRAELPRADGTHGPSEGQRHFCRLCASTLWLFDARWPDLIHPFASAIDVALPPPPTRVHIMLSEKPHWVTPDIKPGDVCFDRYPTESIERWHRARDLWIE